MADERKIFVELTPKNALTLVSFLNEFKPDMEGVANLRALLDAYQQFEDGVFSKITTDDLEDIEAAMYADVLMGKSPNLKRNGNTFL